MMGSVPSTPSVTRLSDLLKDSKPKTICGWLTVPLVAVAEVVVLLVGAAILPVSMIFPCLCRLFCAP